MPDPIVYIDTSEVLEGRLSELKEALHGLVALVEANEPRIIAYSVYFTEDGTRMNIVHIHHDSASLSFHMKVAGPAFPRFAQYIRLLAIDLYGKPSDDLVEQMRQKAKMLGGGTVSVHPLHAGFTRFERRGADVPFGH